MIDGNSDVRSRRRYLTSFLSRSFRAPDSTPWFRQRSSWSIVTHSRLQAVFGETSSEA